MTLEEQAQAYNWTPEYLQTQQDMSAIRDLMATQGAGYMVTGTGSLDNGGDTTAYLPGLMQQAGITPTQGILNSYQNVTGQAYQPGSQTAYNPSTGGYDITGGRGIPTQSPQGVVASSNSVVGGLFGGGAATPNRPADQMATIKGTWNQYLNGQYNANQLKQMMTQYGVNYADIAAATGQTADQIKAMLDGRPQGTTHPASGMVSNVGAGNSNDYMEQLNKYYGAYFQGGQPDNSMLNNWYSTGYSPPPTGFSTANKGASAAQGIVNSLDWKPENTASSTAQLNKYMSQYGLTAKNIADALGFTEQQIIDHFKKYGITVNASNTPQTNAGAVGGNTGWYMDGG